MENKYNNVVEAKRTVLVNFDKPNDGIKAKHLIPLFGMAACLSLNDLSESLFLGFLKEDLFYFSK